MLNVLILDSSATSRHSWYRKISESLQSLEGLSSLEEAFVPNLSLNTLTPEEINYHQPADLYIVGEELITQDPGLLKTIKDKASHIAIIIAVDRQRARSLFQIESLARLGADDLISYDTDAFEVVTKLIILSKRVVTGSKGKIVLIDSAKGGQGVTTISAGLAESLATTGKKILLIDLDSDSQDLSRYLQARPYYNENLSEVLKGTKPLTKENFYDCLSSVFIGSEFFVLPPANFDDYQNQTSSKNLKTLAQLLDLASNEFDFILVDASSLRTPDSNIWYRCCSKLILVVSNDPASCFSTIIKLKLAWSKLGKNQEVLLLENRLSSNGLSSASVRSHINSQLINEQSAWIGQSLIHHSNGSCWPASGQTFHSLGGLKNRQALKICAEILSDQPISQIKRREHLLLSLQLVWNKMFRFWSTWQKQITWKRELLVEPKLIELPRIIDSANI